MPEESEKVKKVKELFKAYQNKGALGIKEVLLQRELDHQKKMDEQQKEELEQ